MNRLHSALDYLNEHFRRFLRDQPLTRGFRIFCDHGWIHLWRQVVSKYYHYRAVKYARIPRYTQKEMEAQKETQFDKNILFSILVPLYNTPDEYLREMIESVQKQTYINWELCLVDGSDDAHNEVERICRQFEKDDERVHYKKLENNLGISQNTNACIAISKGEYLALLDHDDILHPAALYEIMKVICEVDADFIYTDENTFHKSPKDAYNPHYKSDFAPDTLRSNNYICHFTVFSRQLLEVSGGGLHSEYDGSQDYDLFLRLTEQAKKIIHIPKILYYWRSHKNSVAFSHIAKPYTIEAAKLALSDHLKRSGLDGKIFSSRVPSTYRIQYDISGNPSVSILIYNRNGIDNLNRCIRSIVENTRYQFWEILIMCNHYENENDQYRNLMISDKRIHIINVAQNRTYSYNMNIGAKSASGQFLLLLDSNTEVISPDWIEQILMFAQRDDVGVVGAKLYYPDNTVQHAGINLDINGKINHIHKFLPRDAYGYMGRLTFAQNYSAVAGACMMIRNDVWIELHGLDNEYKIAFYDVDLCMRIRQSSRLIVWTPYAELYHHISKRNNGGHTLEQRLIKEDEEYYHQRWAGELSKGDPYIFCNKKIWFMKNS